MKVAIIGAGIAGLSCAHELELHGIKPDIFEKQSKIGEIMNFPSFNLNIISRPIKDVVKFVDKNFNIQLTPLYDLNHIIIKSKNHTSNIRGNLGKIFIKGQRQDSISNQIYNSIKTPVNFDTPVDIKDLQNKYDKIVVATGDQTFPQQFGVWNEYSPSFGARLHRIVGNFELNRAFVWYNTSYAKTGYTYLVPYSKSSAHIGTVVPNTTKEELDKLSDRFFTFEKLNYEIIETFDIEFHVGYTEPLYTNGVYFTGNAGGFVEPFTGCGQFMAIWSGVLAARSIANNLDYNSEAKKLLAKTKRNIKIRRLIQQMDDNSFDKIVKFIGLPGIRNIIYNTNIDFVKYISYLLDDV